MQRRIMYTTFDDRKLWEQTRTAKRRALHAIHQAHTAGRIGREERDEQAAAVQQAFEATWTNARKTTFISDCAAIENYYGGNHAKQS